MYQSTVAYQEKRHKFFRKKGLSHSLLVFLLFACYDCRAMVIKQKNQQDRIVRIPGVVGGKPVVKGTRIPVDMILERLAYDLDLKTLFEDYPQLTQEDIKACFWYARELVEEEELFPPINPAEHQAHASV